MGVFSWGYTGSIPEQLADYYDFVEFDGNLSDCEKGGILLRQTEGSPCAHTCIVSVSGSRVLEACDDFDGMPGDSSGWEVCEKDIHQNVWELFGVPKPGAFSDEAIEAGIAWGRAFAADDSHGYSQDGNQRLRAGDGDGTDCSAFVLLIVGVMIEFMRGVVTPIGTPAENLPGPIEAGEVPLPKYRTWDKKNEWNEWLTGLTDSSSCGDDYAGEAGLPIYDVEFDMESLGGDGAWFQLNLEGGEVLPRNTQNTKREKAVIGITVYYKTPEPDKTGYYKAMYQVHWMGQKPAWGKWEYDDEDGGAGNDKDPIDMFRLTLSR